MQRTSQTPLATDVKPGEALSVSRYFTKPGVDVFDTVDWELRDARIGHGDRVAFEQRGVEFPATWSQNATNIVAQKYFRGQLDTPGREHSVKQMVGRVAGTIADWGRSRGYFASVEHGDAFQDELTYVLLHQMAAFNSPVWFNVGFEESPQCSACSAYGALSRRLRAWCRSASSSNATLSATRSTSSRRERGHRDSRQTAREAAVRVRLRNGSFVRGAAPTMSARSVARGVRRRSGEDRRARAGACGCILHPHRARSRRRGHRSRSGCDMSIDDEGLISIQYQNAKIPFRLTDGFMRGVDQDDDGT